MAKVKELYQLYKLKRKVERNRDTSHAGEFAHLEHLLKSLRIDHGFVVDIAAGDGVNQSSTLGFFKQQNWSGLAVEMDPFKFSSLAFVYADYSDIRLARCRVTPASVRALLESYEVPKNFDLLNLDIDSYDLHIIDEMLKSEYRPKVITMEINEKIPPPIYFTVDYDDAHYWKKDHFFGCSIVAAADVVLAQGYILSSLEYNNAIFVRKDIAGPDSQSLDILEAYKTGYLNKPDRKKLFRWNHDVECLHDLTPEQAEAFLRKLFSDYDGKYTLRLR